MTVGERSSEARVLARATCDQLGAVLRWLQTLASPTLANAVIPFVARAAESLQSFASAGVPHTLPDAIVALQGALRELQFAPAGAESEASTARVAECLGMTHSILALLRDAGPGQLAGTTTNLDPTRPSAGFVPRGGDVDAKTRVERSPAGAGPTLQDVRIQPSPAHPLAASVIGQAPASAGDPNAAASGKPLQVALGTQSDSNFYVGLGGGDVIEAGGLFVATYKRFDVGQPVELHVMLPGDNSFGAWGVVRWLRVAGDDAATAPPGVGVKFTRIAPPARQLVQRFTRNRRPFFFDEP